MFTINKNNYSEETFAKELEQSLEDKSKIRKALAKEDFKDFLIKLGMNQDWITSAATMQIIKKRFAKLLLDSYKIKFLPGEVVFDEGKTFGIKTKSDKRFFLGSENEYLYDATKADDELVDGNGFIKYEHKRTNKNHHERLISPSGVVVHQVSRYGISGEGPKDQDWIQRIELTRIPDRQCILRRECSKIPNGTNQDVTIEEYDYAYPASLDKNGTSHKKTPSYFFEHYPSYKKWFLARYSDKDMYIEKTSDMQDQMLLSSFEQQLQNLSYSAEQVISCRKNLNFACSSIINGFNQPFGGPIYKHFFMASLDKVLHEDKPYSFYTDKEKKDLRDAISSRLSAKPIGEKELSARIKNDLQIFKNSLKNNKSIALIKSTFNEGKRPINNPSITDALNAIQSRSSIIQSFSEFVESPFSIEKQRLDNQLRRYETQLNLLRAANWGVPDLIRKMGNVEFGEEDFTFPSSKPSGTSLDVHDFI